MIFIPFRSFFFEEEERQREELYAVRPVCPGALRAELPSVVTEAAGATRRL